MRTKRIPRLFLKPPIGTRAGHFPDFGVLPNNERCPVVRKNKKHIVIETFDEAGVRRIRVVLLLSVVNDVAYIVHDDVLTTLCLDTVTNAYNVDDGMPTLELTAQKRRFDA
nr:conserved hypothetical protein [Rhizobiaceae bacterium]